MKKITFALFALIAGTTFAQNSTSDTGTATVNAEIVSPISISDGSDLDFGRIIGNAAGGTVTVATDGQRTTDNSDLLAPSTTVQAASFTVNAAKDYNYKVEFSSLSLSDIASVGADMPVTFTSSLGTEHILGTGADQTLTVGGALTVNANQAEGKYTGEVTVTVAYE
jgi:spore coat protein U-like protein